MYIHVILLVLLKHTQILDGQYFLHFGGEKKNHHSTFFYVDIV